MAISNEVLRADVQELLALKAQKSPLDSKIDALVKKIKEELNRRGTPAGELTEFDGPNGGLTYSKTDELCFDDPDKFIEVLGLDAFKACFETTPTLNKKKFEMFCELFKPEDDKLREAATEIKPRTTLTPVFSRKKDVVLESTAGTMQV